MNPKFWIPGLGFILGGLLSVFLPTLVGCGKCIGVGHPKLATYRIVESPMIPAVGGTLTVMKDPRDSQNRLLVIRYQSEDQDHELIYGYLLCSDAKVPCNLLN